MKRIISLLVPLALALGGCDEEEAEQPKPAPRMLPVQQMPPLMPVLPQVHQAPAKLKPPMLPKPTAVPQPSPEQVQADLLAKYQAIYSEYAAGVAKLERDTAHISAKDLKHRQTLYWAPLGQFVLRLQDANQLTGYQLAQLINQGQQDNWPTQQTGDGAAIARMFRRIRSEHTVRMRRYQTDIDMAFLDAISRSLAAQAAATSGGPVVVGRVAPGGGGVLPPIYVPGGAFGRSFGGQVHFGNPTYGR